MKALLIGSLIASMFVSVGASAGTLCIHSHVPKPVYDRYMKRAEVAPTLVFKPVGQRHAELVFKPAGSRRSAQVVRRTRGDFEWRWTPAVGNDTFSLTYPDTVSGVRLVRIGNHAVDGTPILHAGRAELKGMLMPGGSGKIMLSQG